MRRVTRHDNPRHSDVERSPEDFSPPTEPHTFTTSSTSFNRQVFPLRSGRLRTRSRARYGGRVPWDTEARPSQTAVHTKRTPSVTGGTCTPTNSERRLVSLTPRRSLDVRTGLLTDTPTPLRVPFRWTGTLWTPTPRRFFCLTQI